PQDQRPYSRGPLLPECRPANTSANPRAASAAAASAVSLPLVRQTYPPSHPPTGAHTMHHPSVRPAHHTLSPGCCNSEFPPTYVLCIPHNVVLGVPAKPH